jgi:hypothetical protein
VTLKKAQHLGNIKDKEVRLHHQWLGGGNSLLTLRVYITSGGAFDASRGEVWISTKPSVIWKQATYT